MVLLGAIFGPTDEERAAQEAERELESKANLETQKEAARQWYSKLTKLGTPCDEAHSAVSEQFGAMANGKGDRYSAYTVASAAKDACTNSWSAFGDLEVDSLPDASQEKAQEAAETCKLAYFSKKQAAEKMMEFLDGDTRPSVVKSIKEDGEFANRGVLNCVVQAMGAMEEAGVSIEKLADEETEE